MDQENNWVDKRRQDGFVIASTILMLLASEYHDSRDIRSETSTDKPT